MAFERFVIPTEGVPYSSDLDLHTLNLAVGRSVNILFSTSYAAITLNEDGSYGLKLDDRDDRPKSFRSTCGSGPAQDIKLGEALGFSVVSTTEQRALRYYLQHLNEQEALRCLERISKFYVNTVTEETLHPKVGMEMDEDELSRIMATKDWAKHLKPDPNLKPLPQELLDRAKAETQALLERF